MLAAEHMPEHLRPLITQAARVWYEGAALEGLDEDMLAELSDYLIARIQHEMSKREA